MRDISIQKKIFSGSDEPIQDIIKRVIAEKSKKIVLHIVEESVIISSDDFKEIKKQTEKKGREVRVESRSALVIKNAEEAGLVVINASLTSNKRPFVDITLKKPDSKKSPRTPDFFSYIGKKDNSIIESAREELSNDEETDEQEENVDLKKLRVRRRIGLRFLGLFVGIIIGIVLIGALLYYVLPKATVIITLKKTPIDFNEKVVVSSKASSVQQSVSGITIPGELFTARRNLEIPFTSTSTKRVELKATGKLTINNAYSSASQSIVTATRFVSPDGKIFRLDKAVVIPGAKVVNGKLTPSKIDVLITADKAGEEYNISPAKLWKIPGFEGTPKYNGFYAESAASMSGGFIGERPIAGDGDMTLAKNALSSALKDALNGEMAILMSGKYTLLDGASLFSIEKQDVRAFKDDPSSFGLFGEASMKQLVFEEQTLKDAIAEKLKPTTGINFYVYNFILNYGTPQVNLDQGVINFNATGTVVFEENIDKNVFKTQAFGMSEDNLKKAVFALPGLEKANISLWPFWVHNVPTSPGRVSITFE